MGTRCWGTKKREYIDVLNEIILRNSDGRVELFHAVVAQVTSDYGGGAFVSE